MRSAVASRLASALLLLLCAVPVGAQERPDLDGLLARFARVRGLSATFVERKEIALLAAPLVSEGEIHFAAPDRLVRRVTSPTESTVLLSGDRLVMRSNGRREEIDLSRQPVVAGFVDSFRQVLRGDREGLERAYHLRLEGRGSGWRLVLRPRGGPLRRFLTSLELHGEGEAIGAMRMTERSGDVTTTELRDVRADRRFSEAEIRRIFRLP